jgi:hypothetical protein
MAVMVRVDVKRLLALMPAVDNLVNDEPQYHSNAT